MKYLKSSFVLNALITLLFMVPFLLANAQTINSSKGRTNGLLLEYNDHSLKSIKKIRDLINERDYESAANRSITFIRSDEREMRNGIEKSDYFKEAYNCLCVSSAALGKVEYAMDVCNRSLEFTPNHWESLKSRATLYFLTNDYENALKDFNTALENSPEDEAIVNVLKQNIGVVKSKIN